MRSLLFQGSEFTYSRHISRQDILDFAKISNDRGKHHVNPDDKLLAHGLLLASLPTKLGGDLNFIAQSMEFQFVKAVYEDETVSCTGKIERLIEQPKRFKAFLSFTCRNEKGEIVMNGNSRGIIWKTA